MVSHGTLILQNIIFEICVSYGIWTPRAIGEHVTSLLSQPLSHSALQIVINYLKAIQNKKLWCCHKINYVLKIRCDSVLVMNVNKIFKGILDLGKGCHGGKY